jgi:hypothetical protein
VGDGGGERERKRERGRRCGKGVDNFKVSIASAKYSCRGSVLTRYYSKHGNQQNDKVRFFRVNGVGRIKLG